MTSKQAVEIAASGLPVLWKGIRYEKITEVGVAFDNRRGRHNFVTMIDSKNRIVRAIPEEVELAL